MYENKTMYLPAIEYKLKVVGVYYSEPTTKGYYNHIFVSEDIKQHIDSEKIWDDSANGIYLSDHFPIEAVIN